MRTRIIAFGAFLVLLSGCGDKVDAVTVKLPPVPIEAPKPKPTPEAWKAAVESLYTPIALESDSNDEGVTEFMACFGEVVDNRCSSPKVSSAKRDSFRKLRIFWADWLGGALYGNKLGAYVSLRDNQPPSIVLVPHLFSKNGWLFMNQVSVMVDGDVSIDQSFNALDVKRETFPGGYQERMDFVATPGQIEALRKIKPESKVLIRMTGDKAYRNLDKSDVDSFKSSVQNLVSMYDAFQKAVAGKTIPDAPG